MRKDKPLYIRITFGSKTEEYDSHFGLAGFEEEAKEFLGQEIGFHRVTLVRLGWFRFQRNDPPDGRFIEVARMDLRRPRRA